MLLFCCLAGNQVLAAPPSTERGDLVYLLDSSKGTSLQVSSRFHLQEALAKCGVLCTWQLEVPGKFASSVIRKRTGCPSQMKPIAYRPTLSPTLCPAGVRKSLPVQIYHRAHKRHVADCASFDF